jgi:hypothetical protein
MAIVVAIVLALLALAFVLYPLYRQWEQGRALPRTSEPKNSVVSAVEADQEPSVVSDTSGMLDTPDEQEDAARSALQEVEFDYQLGNISEDDYDSLRERYMQRALVALKSRYEHEHEVDQDIEEQLRRLREGHGHTNS